MVPELKKACLPIGPSWVNKAAFFAGEAAIQAGPVISPK
jgi:hypothetical protein